MAERAVDSDYLALNAAQAMVAPLIAVRSEAALPSLGRCAGRSRKPGIGRSGNILATGL